MASLLICLPIVLFVIQPESARANVEKVNEWLYGGLGYVVLAGLFVIGLYLVWHGIEGLRNFLAL